VRRHDQNLGALQRSYLEIRRSRISSEGPAFTTRYEPLSVANFGLLTTKVRGDFITIDSVLVPSALMHVFSLAITYELA